MHTNKINNKTYSNNIATTARTTMTQHQRQPQPQHDSNSNNTNNTDSNNTTMHVTVHIHILRITQTHIDNYVRHLWPLHSCTDTQFSITLIPKSYRINSTVYKYMHSESLFDVPVVSAISADKDTKVCSFESFPYMQVIKISESTQFAMRFCTSPQL